MLFHYRSCNVELLLSTIKLPLNFNTVFTMTFCVQEICDAYSERAAEEAKEEIGYNRSVSINVYTMPKKYSQSEYREVVV